VVRLFLQSRVEEIGYVWFLKSIPLNSGGTSLVFLVPPENSLTFSAGVGVALAAACTASRFSFVILLTREAERLEQFVPKTRARVRTRFLFITRATV
jgi:hypothetical protein